MYSSRKKQTPKRVIKMSIISRPKWSYNKKILNKRKMFIKLSSNLKKTTKTMKTHPKSGLKRLRKDRLVEFVEETGRRQSLKTNRKKIVTKMTKGLS